MTCASRTPGRCRRSGRPLDRVGGPHQRLDPRAGSSGPPRASSSPRASVAACDRTSSRNSSNMAGSMPVIARAPGGPGTAASRRAARPTGLPDVNTPRVSCAAARDSVGAAGVRSVPGTPVNLIHLVGREHPALGLAADHDQPRVVPRRMSGSARSMPRSRSSRTHRCSSPRMFTIPASSPPRCGMRCGGRGRVTSTSTPTGSASHSSPRRNTSTLNSLLGRAVVVGSRAGRSTRRGNRPATGRRGSGGPAAANTGQLWQWVTFASSGHERSPRTPMRFQHASTAMTGSAAAHAGLLPEPGEPRRFRSAAAWAVSPLLSQSTIMWPSASRWSGSRYSALRNASAASPGRPVGEIDHAEQRSSMSAVARGAARATARTRREPRPVAGVGQHAGRFQRIVRGDGLGADERRCSGDLRRRSWQESAAEGETGSRRRRPIDDRGSRSCCSHRRAVNTKRRASPSATNRSAAAGRPRRGSGHSQPSGARSRSRFASARRRASSVR